MQALKQYLQQVELRATIHVCFKKRIHPKLMTTITGGSMAEWSAQYWTHNPAVPGSSPPLANCCTCSLSSQVQNLGYAYK